MLRHGWVQWRSKSGQGDRDFTLRRRGTRDYTHSVKNQKRNPQLVNPQYISATNISDLTTVQRPSTSSIKSDTNDNSVNYDHDYMRHPLQVVSITDTLERKYTPKVLQNNDRYNGSNRNVLNPLGVPSMYGDTGESNSEGYGTIRNGPFIIAKDDFDHVCWRRSIENATHL